MLRTAAKLCVCLCMCVHGCLSPGEKVGWASDDEDEPSASSSEADDESSDDEVPLAKRKTAAKAKAK